MRDIPVTDSNQDGKVGGLDVSMLDTVDQSFAFTFHAAMGGMSLREKSGLLLLLASQGGGTNVVTYPDVASVLAIVFIETSHTSLSAFNTLLFRAPPSTATSTR